MAGVSDVLRRGGLLLFLIVAFASSQDVALAQGALTNGANHVGVIQKGSSQTWTLQATANDGITVSIGEVAGSEPNPNFSPWIRLQGPDGSLLDSQFGSNAAQIDVRAPLTGTYTVLVANADADFQVGPGNYVLTVAKTPGPYTVSPGDEGGPMTNGADHAGVIQVGDLDPWTFQATQNDGITVSIGEVAGSGPNPNFTPWIRLRGPDGSLLDSQFGSSAAQIDVRAPLTGTYTVLVANADADFQVGSGNYVLTVAKTPGPYTVSPGDEGGPMTNGANHAGVIQVGDLDPWTVQATQNDGITVSIGEVAGSGPNPNFTPWIRLRGPDGSLLDSQFGSSAAQIDVRAPLTGTYTVLVANADADFQVGPGNYVLTVAKTPGPYTVSPGDEGGPMTNGANHAGVIQVGDLDPWTFQATQNDGITVSVGEVAGSGPNPNFTPWIRLRGPDGSLLDSQFGSSAAQIDVRAPLTGTYTVLVANADADFQVGPGNYVLTVAKTPGPYSVSPGDEGGPMTNGTSYPGVIQVGDLDPWTFQATQNDGITVSVGEVAGSGTNPNFTPWIRLRGPDGSLLDSRFGSSAAQIDVRAPLTGTYTVLVANADADFQVGPGNYLLKVTGLTAAASPPVVNAFTASPSMIAAGQSSTLSWTTTNATTVSISWVTGTQPANGSVSVSPAVTTTYTLTATGSDGTATATTTITLVTFSAPMPSAPVGSGISRSPTFSWSSVGGATSYRLMVATAAGGLPVDPASSNCSGCAINITLQTNYFNPSTPLSSTMTYYWQVQGRNAAKNGPWSARASFTTAAPPEQTQPDRGNLAEDFSGPWPTPAGRAVVITHGWNDTGAGWVEEMAGKVCGKLGAATIASSIHPDALKKMCQTNDWDVWILDWNSKAATGSTNPMGAYVNAIDVGQNLALILKDKSYSHIHLIAHSAGANLIDFATVWLRYWVTKEGRAALAIHETFLDAYDPVSDPTRYGRQADWVDNYVDTRDVADLFYGLDGTKLFLQNGYNIDVTPIVPALSVDSCLAFSPTLFDVWSCRHNRPYRFYGLSVDPSYVGNIFSASYDPIEGNSTGGVGYPLSLENGHSLSLLNNLYPKGGKCVMNGGICYAGGLPPSVWTFLPDAVAGTIVDSVTGIASYAAGTGVTLFSSIKLGVISLLPNSADPVGRTSFETPTDSASWIAGRVTTTQPVNKMRFEWRFAAAGEGFLRVFVDGILVREIDQRHVSSASLTTEEIYIGGDAGMLAPGTHDIAFRLDGYASNASGVELTGVEVGLTSQLPGRRRSVRP